MLFRNGKPVEKFLPEYIYADEEAGGEANQADQAEMLIRLGVMQAYTGILEAQAGLDAARKSLDHLDEVLRSAQANYEAGYLPLSDLLAVEVAQLQMQQTVRQLESGLEMARSALSVLIGADIRDRWALVPVAYPEEEIPYTLDSLWEWALEWRPDLRSIDSQRESLEAQISAIASARRPIVSFDAEYSISGEDLFPSGQEKLQGMISVYWDVHDFGRTDDLVAPYEEQIDLLDIQRAELEGQIMQEVESHFLNVQTQLGNLEVSRIALVQAEDFTQVLPLSSRPLAVHESNSPFSGKRRSGPECPRRATADPPRACGLHQPANMVRDCQPPGQYAMGIVRVVRRAASLAEGEIRP